jgi:hypothetical protein
MKNRLVLITTAIFIGILIPKVAGSDTIVEDKNSSFPSASVPTGSLPPVVYDPSNPK